MGERSLPEGAASVASVSIKTVAARAGVSFQTASKVLNGKGSVSGRDPPADPRRREPARLRPERRRAGAWLPARPGPSASSPATSRTTCWRSSSSAPSARPAGRVTASSSASSVTRVATASDTLRSLVERRVEGILLAAPELERQPSVGEILGRRCRSSASTPCRVPEVTLVGSNHVETGLLATRHLIDARPPADRHHHRTAQSTGRPQPTARLRAGAARGRASSFDADLVEEGDWHVEGGYAAAPGSRARARPDRVVRPERHDGDRRAERSCTSGADRPRTRCALVSCDDIPAARHTIPPLTTVRIPLYETGATAMRLLLERIAAPAGSPPGAAAGRAGDASLVRLREPERRALDDRQTNACRDDGTARP